MMLTRFALFVFLLLTTTATAADLSKLRTWEGGATPPLSLPDLNGKQRSLSDYRGSIVVINFWATWCGPCVKEMPSLVRLAEKFSGEPFELLTVNFGESARRVQSFLKKNQLDVPVLVDADTSASRPWVMKGLPTTFIIDAQQKIRYEIRGDLAWDSPDIEDLLRKLLPQG